MAYKSIIVLLLFLMFVTCKKQEINVESTIYQDTVKKKSENTIGEDPLVTAVQHKDEEIIRLLIRNGADPNTIVSKDGTSLLQWAIVEQNRTLMRFLVENGADINYKEPNGATVFGYTGRYLDGQDLLFLIESGVDLTGSVCTYFKGYHQRAELNKAIILLNNDVFLQEILQDKELVIDIIEYWHDGSRQLADMLLAKGYQLDEEQPLWPMAMIRPGAVKWLLDNGISTTRKVQPYGPRDRKEGAPPLEYAKVFLWQLQHPKGIDGTYPDNKEEIKSVEETIRILEEHTKI
jgi:hypothetical protein